MGAALPSLIISISNCFLGIIKVREQAWEKNSISDFSNRIMVKWFCSDPSAEGQFQL
jgi:hypothetical protein